MWISCSNVMFFGGWNPKFSRCEFWGLFRNFPPILLGIGQHVKNTLKPSYQNFQWTECTGWSRESTKYCAPNFLYTILCSGSHKSCKILCTIMHGFNMGSTLFNIRSEITWKYQEIVTRPHHKSQSAMNSRSVIFWFFIDKLFFDF